MSQQQRSYDILFDGQLRPGFDEQQVRLNLATEFGFSAEEIDDIFGGGSVILYHQGQQAEALTMRQSFTRAGLMVRIEANVDAEAELSAQDPKGARAADLEPAALAAKFATPLEGEPPSRGYQMRLWGVAGATLLLPILYGEFLLVMALLLASHFAQLPSLWLSPDGSWVMGLVALALAIVGLLLLLIALKPLVALYNRPERIPVTAEEQPRLFSLLSYLCHYLQVPIPDRVQVDSEVHVTVGLAHGWRGLFDRKLALTVGLPVAGGLNARHFVGALAHEFGHFSQRGALEAYCIINGVNAWLYRRAHRSDRLDDWFQEWFAEHRGSQWARGLNRAYNTGKKLARGIFGLMFQLSLTINQSLSRHMEFEADKQVLQTVGTEAFKPIALSLYAMAYAAREANAVNGRVIEQRNLFSNLPAAIVRRFNHYSQDDWHAFESQTQKIKTRAWDFHPADRERIERAMATAVPGVFHYEGPASQLFSEFDALCIEATTSHYLHWGIEDPDEFVIANEQIFVTLGPNWGGPREIEE
ncbi:MAG: M48 family metallopeptidase [Candidatus Competibacterales bacterium]